MSAVRSLIVLAITALLLPPAAIALTVRQQAAVTTGSNVQYHTVTNGDVAVVVSAIGSLEAVNAARLSFLAGGRVAEVLVAPGQYVEAGDPLVRLEDTAQRIAYEQALTAQSLAELQLERLLRPVDELAVRVAEANVNSAWGAYRSIVEAVSEDDIRAAELRYQQALTALEDARRARFDADAGLPEERYALLDAQVGQASFNAEIARLQLETLRSPNTAQRNAAYARVLQAQAELERARAGPTQSEIERAELAVEQAAAQVEQARAALDRMTLTAPFSSVVGFVNAEVGALVGPGLPIVELISAERPQLRVAVDEVDIRKVAVGMAAQVQLDALPRVRLPALVEDIALVGRSDGGIVSYDVRLALTEVDPRMRVGMTAEANIIVAEARDVLVVPNIYVRLEPRSDRAFVNLVQPDGTLRETEIQLGLRSVDWSEVTAGLRVGDVIGVELGGRGLSFFGG
ncbi:MAG: efflux RND transporter periplasmic adaptor subunit [Aggregatilineales bacterium]